MDRVTRRALLSSSGVAAMLVRAASARSQPVSPASALEQAKPVITKLLEELDARPHWRSGSTQELELADRLEAELTTLGFKISRQQLEVPWFEERIARIDWEGGSVPVAPQRLVVATGPTGVVGPLRICHRPESAGDLAGTIALVPLPPRRHSQIDAPLIRERLDAVARQVPAAIVLLTDGPTGETIWLNAPFSQPVAPMPLATLGPVPARALLAHAATGGAATLFVDGEAGTRRSHNLVAEREGGGKVVVVSTPRTGWTPAVGERGPGLATFLLLARWAAKSLPGRRLLFLNTTAHEFNNEGGRQFLESRMAPAPDEVLVWAHLGAGFAGRAHHDISVHQQLPLPSVDHQRFLVGHDDLLPDLREAFAGQPGLEAPYPASAGAAGELSEILAAGHTRAFGLFGAHVRHHLISDRLAATDPQWIAAAADSIAQVLRRSTISQSRSTDETSCQ